ncbi:MAG: UDP-N-acetylmuramate--L-alanine ligase [Schwartzia sp.]|nr:UDP-N-acetylmuramate--L-alanine ligase [Schwartzia sp. (in: firmicutes)]
MLEGIRKVHFIGVGGAGMSALARILLDKGYEVSGSDIKSSAVSRQLAERGARIFQGHAAENVGSAEAIVVSSAIGEDNPEVVAAKERGLRRLHRSDVNAALVNAVKGIAVAGAHGKTTTTSMIGLVLEHAGVDPTIVIGGQVDYLEDGNARLGRGEYLVSEADESDGSFLKLLPHIAVVTNIENDHMDHYGTMENIKKAFRRFLENVDRESGYCVLCYDNDNVREIAKTLDRRIVSYAIDHPADYRAVNIEPHGTGIAFDVEKEGEILGRVELNIPGRHNVLDAMAAVITGLLCGLTVKEAAEGLAIFHGAKRRFETKGRAAGVWVVDDYAHHPTEIRATLRAARQTNPKRLICVFQPHRYSRTQLLRDEFGGAFGDADLLVLTDIYSAGEAPLKGVNGATIFSAVEETTHQTAAYIASREHVAAYLESIVEEGDLVLTMGAGDIYRTGEELVTRLRAKEARTKRTGTQAENIVVVMGGPSSEAEVSRRSGAAILAALRAKGHTARGLEFSPNTFSADIDRLKPTIVFNAMHGAYGEDGRMQAALELLGIPYTGSGVLASALTMDKVMIKNVFLAAGIPTPRSRSYRRFQRERGLEAEIAGVFSLPVVVKAACQGSSIGVFIVTKAEELPTALDEAFRYDDEVLVEEYIEGTELTAAVWGSPEAAESMPVIEITTESGRYDYASKYTVGASHHIIPARIDDETMARVREAAEKTFLVCGCRGVARMDIMLSKDGTPYVIDVNTMPGMTETSLVPDAARAMGVSFEEFCERLLEMAVRK